MNLSETSSNEEERELENRLKELHKEKWKIWRVIPLVILLPTVGPYVPMRRGMLADRMGYQNAALLFGVILLIVVPIGCHLHFKKINLQIVDAECELENLKRKNKPKNDIVTL